jgi:hypothetical protein
VFVYGTISAAGTIRRKVELAFFDKISGAVAQVSIDISKGGQSLDVGIVDAIINGIGNVGCKFSNALRRVESGIPQDYVTVFALGLFALIVAIFILR